VSRILQHYDTSAYPKTHPLYSPVNAKVIGKFKDETISILTEEFVGSRAKIYSLKCSYPKMSKKSKTRFGQNFGTRDVLVRIYTVFENVWIVGSKMTFGMYEFVCVVTGHGRNEFVE